MRNSDFKRLAKISIKSRKKSTRNTVTGICFGLIMLIPVIFFSLSFYIGLTGEVNKVNSLSTFEFVTRNVYDDNKVAVSESYNDFGILANNAIDKLEQSEHCAETIKHENYNITELGNTSSDNSSSSISIRLHKDDGKEVDYIYTSPKENSGGRTPKKLKVAHVSDSNFKYVLDAELNDMLRLTGKRSIFSAGEGFSKEGLGKGEVLLSQTMLDRYDIKQEDILDKKITLLGKAITSSGNGNVTYKIMDSSASSGSVPHTTDIKLFQQFVVKGIINDKYYGLPSATNDGDIWITSKSVYLNDDYNTIGARVIYYDNEAENSRDRRYSYVYSPSIRALEQTASENGVMMMGMGLIHFDFKMYNMGTNNMTNTKNVVVSPLVHKVQPKDFNAAQKLEKVIYPTLLSAFKYHAESASQAVGIFATDGYVQLAMINTVGGYLMMVLFSFGGIIFFATMLNLYNSVNYSVQSRKNYMGVMRAIGAKQKMIPKLYFFEIVLIFLRALPWVLIFSGLMSFGIKYGVDVLFKYIGASLGISISLNFWFFALTLGMVILLVFGIAIAFSQIACKYAASRPILDVLSDDKG